MESNATITLSSIYRGQLLFKLALSYGKLNFIAPATGQGKTALGLFLRQESFRRLGIEASSPLFVPGVDWEILVEGSLGFVEFISVDGAKGRLIDYLNFKAPLTALYGQKGRVLCSNCRSELYQRGSREFQQSLLDKGDKYLLFGIDLTIRPETVLPLLEWARLHSISRILVKNKVLSAPKTPAEDATYGRALFEEGEAKIDLMLVREVLKQDAVEDNFSRSIGELLDLAEIASAGLGVIALPKLKIGEVLVREEREFTLDRDFNLVDPYLCLSCGAGFKALPESQIDNLTLLQLQQIKLKDLSDFFEKYFPSDWKRIFELELGESYLSQSIEELPERLLIELRLLSLLLSEIRDSLIFIDSKLSSKGKVYAVELTMLGNAIVSQQNDGISLTDFLPSKLQRPSEILDRQRLQKKSVIRRNSIEPLLIETGIEKSIVELYASLPEARVRNLSAKDLSFHAAKCMDCLGAGYSVINIASLGKIAEVCKTCFGARYQEKVSFVKYQEVSLTQLLELRIEQASELLSKRPEILGQLVRLMQLGLASYKLGDEWRTLPSSAKEVLGGKS